MSIYTEGIGRKTSIFSDNSLTAAFKSPQNLAASSGVRYKLGTVYTGHKNDSRH